MWFKRKERIEKKLEKQQKYGAGLFTITEPHSLLAEQFRFLRTNLNFSQFDRQRYSLLVSSSIPAEGKSTIAANLALSLVADGQKVLLLDADLRKPTVNRTFRIDNKLGLSSLLINPDWRPQDIIQTKNGLQLDLLPSGPIPPNPAEILGSNQMPRLLEELKQVYEVIVIDAPPLLGVTDSHILARLADSVLMVVRQNYVKKEEVSRSKMILERAGANVLGFVMNAADQGEASGYYGEQAENE